MTVPWVPLRRLADVRTGKIVNSEPSSPAEVEAPYVTAANVQPLGRVIEVEGKSMWFTPKELAGACGIRVGDLLVVEGGAGFGRPGIVPEAFDGWGFQNHINRIRPRDELADARFLYYAFEHLLFSGQTAVVAQGATLPTLSSDKVRGLCVPYLALERQREIADFLDRETTQIDAMIEAQRDLVTWLEERRSAIVTQVVFAAVGRESMPLRYGIRPLEQGWSPVCENGNVDDPSTQWSVLKVGCVNTGRFDSLQNKALPPEVEPRPELTVRAGDVLVSRGNTRELVGGAAMVDRDYPALMLSDLLYRIRVRPERLRPLFLSLALQTRPVRDQIEMKAKGTSHSMQKISQQDLRELVIPLASLTVQAAIETQVSSTTAKMVAMIDAANESVALMQERRSALISAAVTGRIDPRTGEEPEVAA